jgi:hypothetical protein
VLLMVLCDGLFMVLWRWGLNGMGEGVMEWNGLLTETL